MLRAYHPKSRSTKSAISHFLCSTDPHKLFLRSLFTMDTKLFLSDVGELAEALPSCFEGTSLPITFSFAHRTDLPSLNCKKIMMTNQSM